MRMPRVHVYLPDDLYSAMRDREWSPSKMLQDALRTELRREELVAEMQRYVDELTEEIGEPTAEAMRYAESIVQKVKSHAAAVGLA